MKQYIPERFYHKYPEALSNPNAGCDACKGWDHCIITDAIMVSPKINTNEIEDELAEWTSSEFALDKKITEIEKVSKVDPQLDWERKNLAWARRNISRLQGMREYLEGVIYNQSLRCRCRILNDPPKI